MSNDNIERLEKLLESMAVPVAIQSDCLGAQRDEYQLNKQMAHEAVMSRTIGKELDDKIARLQEQLNAACALRAEIVHAGLADMRVEPMRQLLFY